MDLEEIEITSTIVELEQFKKSTIWYDIQRELEAWKLGFSREQESMVDNIASENPSTAAVLTHLGSISGRMKAVDYILNLPDMFISILEDKANDSGRDRADQPENDK